MRIFTEMIFCSLWHAQQIGQVIWFLFKIIYFKKSQDSEYFCYDALHEKK
jgi:hypothetical protein